MTTDLEKVRELLDSLGVGYVSEPSNINNGTTSIRCGRKLGEAIYEQYPKVGGYTGFYVAFEFDADGKFIEIGAWE